MIDDSKTTPRRLWRDGLDMFDAAVVLMERAKKSNKEEMRLLFPTYYLLGHGIEVTLKAVLRENGSSLDELKNVIRHDLNEAAQRVVKLKLDQLSGFVENHITLVQRLNQYYSAKSSSTANLGTCACRRLRSFCCFSTAYTIWSIGA